MYFEGMIYLTLHTEVNLLLQLNGCVSPEGDLELFDYKETRKIILLGEADI